MVWDKKLLVLERAILKEMKKREKVAPHHVVHFHIQAGYSHAFRSASFIVKEFVKSAVADLNANLGRIIKFRGTV